MGITEGSRFTIGVWRCHDTYGWDHAIEASFVGLTDWHRALWFVAERLPGAHFHDPKHQASADSTAATWRCPITSRNSTVGDIDLRWTKRQGKDALVYDPGGYWKRAAEDGSVFSFLLGIHDAELDERFTYNVRRATRQHDDILRRLYGPHDEQLARLARRQRTGLQARSLVRRHPRRFDGLRQLRRSGRRSRTSTTRRSGPARNARTRFHTAPGAISDMSLLGRLANPPEHAVAGILRFHVAHKRGTRTGPSPARQLSNRRRSP